MVALRRTINLWELAVCPVIVSAIDDNTAHSCAVTINPLRSRINHNVCAPIEWVAQKASRTKGVIHHKWHILTLRHLCQCLQIGHVAGRVAHTLGVDALGILINQCLEVLCLLALGDAAVDTQLTQRDAELIIGTTIEKRRCHDVVTCLRQSCDGQKDSRHTRRHRQSTHSIVESRDTLLIGCGCGVVQTGVDVTALAQLEEFGCIVAALEMVGCGRVDSHTA